MKKLLLTSTGLTNEIIKNFFVQQFDRLDNKKALMVASKNPEEYEEYLELCREELTVFGVKTDIINISEDIDVTCLAGYDIYFVRGGNTFYILDRLRKTGMDRVLMDAIASGKFYLGVSAGSMLVGPDIILSGEYGEDDANHVGLQDTIGFDAVPYFILPHHERHQDSIALQFESQLKRNQAIIGLTDDQTLWISDTEALLLGKKDGGLLVGNVSGIQDHTVS